MFVQFISRRDEAGKSGVRKKGKKVAKGQK
jgi:hypothetical protein